MLCHDMDIPEVPLYRVLGVKGVRTRRMENHIDRSHRLMDRVSHGEPRPGDLASPRRDA